MAAPRSDDSIRRIIETSYPNPNSRTVYLQRLQHLQAVMDGAALHDILSNPDAYYPKMRAAFQNISTRKNYLTLVLALFKHSPELLDAMQEKRDRWAKFHDDMESFQRGRYKKNTPGAAQLAKYTPWEDIAAKYRELGKRGDPHASLGTSLEYLLLSVVSAVPPKRSDYGSMRVYYGKDPNKADENYVVLRKQRSYMVFTKYKTSKFIGRVDEELPLPAERDAKDSLRRHPRQHLFVNRYGEPFADNHAFSRYVTRVFTKHFGRATGVTMLRHIYITEKVSWDTLSDEQLDEISRQMMHSSGIQRKYHWSRDAVCANMQRVCKAACGHET